MSQIILKCRQVGPLQADRITETRRLLELQQCISSTTDKSPSEAQIESLLWTTRALPLVIDALMDARSGVQASGFKWRSIRVLHMSGRVCEGPIWMAATYRPQTHRVQVACFELASSVLHPRKAWLQVQFELNPDVARPMDVSIQRFRIP